MGNISPSSTMDDVVSSCCKCNIGSIPTGEPITACLFLTSTVSRRNVTWIQKLRCVLIIDSLKKHLKIYNIEISSIYYGFAKFNSKSSIERNHYINLTSFTLDPCRGVSCENYGVCKPNPRFLLGYQCQCPTQCPPGVSKVCGSDGRTYRSECELKRESCQRKIRITISYRGSCG